MKKTALIVFALFAWAHTATAEQQGVKIHRKGFGATIHGMSYDMTIECEAPMTAYYSSVECKSGTVLNVALLSSLSLKETLAQKDKILACMKSASFVLNPFPNIKACDKPKALHFKSFDNTGRQFHDQKMPNTHIKQ